MQCMHGCYANRILHVGIDDRIAGYGTYFIIICANVQTLL